MSTGAATVGLAAVLVEPEAPDEGGTESCSSHVVSRQESDQWHSYKEESR